MVALVGVRRAIAGMGWPQPAAVHALEMARDDAPGRRSEFHPPAGRGIVGPRPQLYRGPRPSLRA